MLHTILETKRKEIQRLHRDTNLTALQAAVAAAPPPRDFYATIAAEPRRAVNLIAEIKKASPSKGLIREDFNPPVLAWAYAQAGANAISILTDETYFQGSLAFLRQVRQAVDLPLLRKDFIIDSWQIYEARAAGADAILLIAAALEPAELVELMAVVGELGMTVLLELHNAAELAMWQEQVRPAIMELKRKFPHLRWLLGINNRDLTTFNVDLDTTIRLMARAGGDEVVVSESGIATPQDVNRLAAAGVRGILVGETFMRSDDVGDAIKTLLGPTEGKE
ncbi:MAG: indole-3-glycerol phosphate synthase TrpC [Phycisphaerae bacterium]|nr:indole-3-glycerol phosphate synthase TrpC [Phycisphaerae bacterium]